MATYQIPWNPAQKMAYHQFAYRLLPGEEALHEGEFITLKTWYSSNPSEIFTSKITIGPQSYSSANTVVVFYHSDASAAPFSNEAIAPSAYMHAIPELVSPTSMPLSSTPGDQINFEVTGDISYIDVFNILMSSTPGYFSYSDQIIVSAASLTPTEPVGGGGGEPPAGTAPTLVADTFSTDFETAVSIPVLANDSSGSSAFDLATLSVSDVIGGTAVADGSNVLYTPSQGFSGTGSFNYTIANVQGLTASSSASGTIAAPPEPVAPTLYPDTFSTDFETAVSIPVLANDSSGSSAFDLATLSVSDVIGGTAVADGSNVLYTPSQGFSGTGSFNYTIANVQGLTASSSASGNVAPRPVVAPTLLDKAVAVEYGVAVVVDVLEGANSGSSDFDLTTLSISESVNAVIEILDAGNVRITPVGGFYGELILSASISNLDGLSDTSEIKSTWAAPDRENIAPGTDSAPEKFQWVLFNSLTGAIIKTLNRTEDNVKRDINSTDEAAVTLDLSSLSVAERNDWARLFEYYDRSIALCRRDSFGLRTGNPLYAGPILKREFSTGDQTIFLKCGAVPDILAKIPAVWPALPLRDEPIQTFEADSIGGLLVKALESALNGPAGVRTIKDTIILPAASGTGVSYSYDVRKIWSAFDVLKDIKEKSSGNGKSTEYLFKPIRIDGPDGEFFKYQFITGTSSVSHINADQTVTVSLFEDETKTWEPVVWDINDDASGIFTRLYVDGSGDLVYIDAIDRTPADSLTLIQVFAAGVDLTEAEMNEQLAARIKNSRISEKDTTLRIAGDSDVEWLDNLGKMVVLNAGPTTAGTGTTLRAAEIHFSTDDVDINVQASLVEPAGVYPKLPAARKKDALGGSGEYDSVGLDKPEDIKAGFGDAGMGADLDKGEGLGGGFTPGGAIEKPESPEPEPKTVGGLADTDLTLFETAPGPLSLIAHSAYVPKDATHFAGYFATQVGSDDPEAPGFANPFSGTYAEDFTQAIHPSIDIFEHAIHHTPKTVDEPSAILGSSKTKIGTIPGTWILEKLNTVGWFPPAGESAYVDSAGTVTFSEVGRNNTTEIMTYFRIVPGPLDNRLYFHAVSTLGYGINSAQYFQVFAQELREIFFTVDRTETGFENFEVLASPAQQIFESTGKDLAICFSNQRNMTGRSATRTPADFFEIEAGKYVFPYAQIATTFLSSQNSNGQDSHAPLVDKMAARGITAEHVGNVFGILYADFSTKQPIFAESEIELPLPRPFVQTRRGAVKGTSNANAAWDANHEAYNLYNSWQSYGGYSFVAQSSFHGLTVAPHFEGLDDAQLKSLFNVEGAESFEEFKKRFCNKVWVLFKGKTEFEEISLPSDLDPKTQAAFFSVASDGETVHTYINGGASRPLAAMNQSGKSIKIAVDTSTADETPMRAFTGHAKNVNVDNFAPFLSMQNSNVYSLTAASIGASPWRAKPSDAFARDFIVSEEASWMEKPKAGVDFPVSSGMTAGFSYGAKYFKPLMHITMPFKSVDRVKLASFGLSEEGKALRWGKKPSATSADNVFADGEFSPSPVDFGGGKNFKTVRASGLGMNGSEFVGVVAVDDAGIVYYAGPTTSPAPDGYAASDSLIAFSSVQMDGKKMIDAVLTAGGILAIGDDRSLYGIGNISSSAFDVFTKIDDSSINGKIAAVDSVASVGAAIVLTTAGSLYGRGTNHAGGSVGSGAFEALTKPSEVSKWKDAKIVWSDSSTLGAHYILAIDDSGKVWRTDGDDREFVLQSFDYSKFKFEKVSARKAAEERDWTALASDSVALIAQQKSIHRPPAGGSGSGPYAGTTIIFGGDAIGSDMTGGAGVPDGEGSSSAIGAGGGSPVGGSSSSSGIGVGGTGYPGGEGSEMAMLENKVLNPLSGSQTISMIEGGWAGAEGAEWRMATGRISTDGSSWVEAISLAVGDFMVDGGSIIFTASPGNALDSMVHFRIGTTNGETVRSNLQIRAS